MWKLSKDLTAKNVRIRIPRTALEAIYDECDGFDVDETGGRLIGTYQKQSRGGLNIIVSGIIESGPNARRSNASFFQDGAYQEAVFRKIEDNFRDIEHLGNWHTHHVNGYPTLSGGDRTTYHNIVNHQSHNTDFFYALLVIAKNERGPGERYQVKHFIVFRDQRDEYEIPSSHVTVTNDPIIWPQNGTAGEPTSAAPSNKHAEQQRVKDRDYFEDFHPEFQPYQSKSTGGLYWKGRLELVDGTIAQVAVAETVDDEGLGYSAAIKAENDVLSDAVQQLGAARYPSARAGVRKIENMLNKTIFKSKH